MSPVETKKKFVWKSASPVDRALRLAKIGTFMTATQDIKEKCCICDKKIRQGEDYRVFYNNNIWKGHDACIKNRGQGVQEIRIEQGQRIFWDQLSKTNRAIMLLKVGVTFTARANTPGLCTFCGRRLKAGETVIRNHNYTHLGHKEEAETIKREYEAKKAAEFREAEKKQIETPERVVQLAPVAHTPQPEDASMLSVAEATATYVPQPVPTTVGAREQLIWFAGYRQAVIDLSGGKKKPESGEG